MARGGERERAYHVSESFCEIKVVFFFQFSCECKEGITVSLSSAHFSLSILLFARLVLARLAVSFHKLSYTRTHTSAS